MAPKINPLNLSGVKSTMEPLPVGTYDMVFVGHTIGEVKSGDNKGAPMLGLQAKPNKEFYPKYGNRSVFTNIPIIAPDESTDSKGTYWKVRQFGEALGLSDEEFANLDLERLNQYYGRHFVARITQREYEGEKRNDMTNFKPPAEGGMVPAGGPSDLAGAPDEEEAPTSRGRKNLG